MANGATQDKGYMLDGTCANKNQLENVPVATHCKFNSGRSTLRQSFSAVITSLAP